MLRRSGGASFSATFVEVHMLLTFLDCRERLADMAERTKQLEDASHSFAAQVCYCLLSGVKENSDESFFA